MAGQCSAHIHRIGKVLCSNLGTEMGCLDWVSYLWISMVRAGKFRDIVSSQNTSDSFHCLSNNLFVYHNVKEVVSENITCFEQDLCGHLLRHHQLLRLTCGSDLSVDLFATPLWHTSRILFFSRCCYYLGFQCLNAHVCVVPWSHLWRS
jgi:hypothetical protein